MSLSYSRFRPAYFLLILFVLSACTNRPSAEAITKFSVALEGTSASVQQGLGEIQRLEIAVNDAAEAESFVRNKGANIQLNRDQGITDSVIAPRLKFFKALSKYASSLAAAASDDQIEKVREQFTATGTAFTELSKSVIEKSGEQFPTDLANNASTAFASLGVFMVEAKLNREIPIIVAKTHDDLTKGVEAFKTDLGDPDAGGFRTILNDSINTLIGQKKKYLQIIKAENRASKAELYSAVIEAQEQVRELQKSERLLAAIPFALDKMLDAHKALMNPKEQTSIGKIEVFFQRAKELQSIINGLKS